MKYLLLVTLSVLVSQAAVSQNSGNLSIEVTALHNNQGKVGIRVFDKSSGFPSNRKNAIKEFFVTPVDGKAVFKIDNLAFGTYAVGAIHDENENQEFDKNFLGYPKEGFGTSNNPKILLGPPSFNKAKFAFSTDGYRLEIKMLYF